MIDMESGVSQVSSVRVQDLAESLWKVKMCSLGSSQRDRNSILDKN